MSNILFLYDTIEKDLARDFWDFLKEIGLENINMILQSPDLGGTLQDKEKQYFDSADGVIFLITPGSMRAGKLFPSPSVSTELGLAMQKFKNPERVMYLVDKKCNMPTIDQHCYIQFNREDIRSILEALTQLVKNLKQAGLFMDQKIEDKEILNVDIPKLSESIDDRVKQICVILSNELLGIISLSGFCNLLKQKYNLTNQEINFTQQELIANGLISTVAGSKEVFLHLTIIGWQLVRYEAELEKKKQKEKEEKLTRLLSDNLKSKIPKIMRNER